MRPCRAGISDNQSGGPGGLEHVVPRSRGLPRARLERGQVKEIGPLISASDLHFGKLILQAVCKE